MQQINSINVVGKDGFFGVFYGVLIPINNLTKKYDRLFDIFKEIEVILFCNKYKHINADLNFTFFGVD